MVGKYTVTTLCGSTRFKEDFLEQQKLLTLQGYIVISVGLFGHSGDDEVWTEGTREMLDDMHKRKIDMADEIYVINKNGYIGESTLSEIKYAKSKEMPIGTGKYKITRLDKEIIELTKNEYNIMYFLVKNQGQVVSRDEIMDYLWESEEFIDDNTLSVNIKRLRTKLEELGTKDLIETRRGQGYLLK